MTKESKNSNWLPLVKNFLALFLPLCLLAAGVVALVYRQNLAIWQTSLKDAETNHVALEKQVIVSDFREVVSDLHFLAVGSSMARLSGNPSTELIAEISFCLLEFTKAKKLYDQVRVLDNRGVEIVRVNYNHGHSHLVPPGELQDKSKRYYFKEAIKLKPGQVFVSVFDLNMEKGRIEKPLKPMIRFAVPLMGADGRPWGVLVLNYLGGKLLKSLIRVHSGSIGEVMLLNSGGYWLLDKKGGKRAWGFMWKSGRDRTMAVQEPKAWKKIITSEQGQVSVKRGLYTFQTVYPLQEAGGGGRESAMRGGDRFWKLISFIPAQNLEQLKNTMALRYLYILLGLSVFIAATSLYIARSLEIRKKIRRDLLKANQALNIWVARLEEQSRETALLNQMSDLIQACDSEEEIYPLVEGYAAKLFSKDCGCLAMIDSKSGFLGAMAHWGPEKCCTQSYSQQDCWALRRGRGHVARAGQESPVCRHFYPPPEFGHMCLPLIAHGAMMGVLTVEFGPGDKDMPESERARKLNAQKQLAQNIADILSLSISNLRLRVSLREQSIRDALTGLFNRRYMEEAMASQGGPHPPAGRLHGPDHAGRGSLQKLQRLPRP